MTNEISLGPTWSSPHLRIKWASLDSGVVYFAFLFDDKDEEPPDVISEVVSCSTKAAHSGLNPLGEILSGYIILKGPVRRAWFKPATSNMFIILGPIISIATEFTTDEIPMTFEAASKKHAKDFLDANIDPDVVAEDPDGEFLYGTYLRNMCGQFDEILHCEPFIVLCIGINMNSEVQDGVRGLLLVNNVDGSNDDQLKRIGSFERGRNCDFENETKSQIYII